MLKAVNTRRPKTIAIAIGVGLFCAVIISLARGESGQFLLRTGDFPAFYTAGKLAQSGSASDLYSPSKQQQFQAEFFPGLPSGHYYAFAYPPFFALPFAAFSSLDPIPAKLIWIGLMVCALALSSYIIARIRHNEVSSDDWIAVILWILTFSPVFIGLAAGQNSALSLLFFSLLFLSVKSSKAFSPGLAVGLWFFKPHFASLALLVALIAGRYRIAVLAVLVFSGYFLISVFWFGSDWLKIWIAAVGEFSRLEGLVNAYQQVSLVGVITHFSTFSNNSIFRLLIALIGAAIWLAVLLCLLKQAYLSRRQNARWEKLLLLLGPAIVLLSPHTMFYDAGLCAVPLIVLSGAKKPKTLTSTRALISIWLFVALLRVITVNYEIELLWLLALVLFFWLYRVPEAVLDSAN